MVAGYGYGYHMAQPMLSKLELDDRTPEQMAATRKVLHLHRHSPPHAKKQRTQEHEAYWEGNTRTAKKQKRNEGAERLR